PYRMGELEAVKALADFLDELAVGPEFPQAGAGATEEGEIIALGVGGHTLQLAHGVTGRRLEEVRHRLVRQIGRRARSGGGGLRKGRPGAEQQGQSGSSRQMRLHENLPS